MIIVLCNCGRRLIVRMDGFRQFRFHLTHNFFSSHLLLLFLRYCSAVHDSRSGYCCILLSQVPSGDCVDYDIATIIASVKCGFQVSQPRICCIGTLLFLGDTTRFRSYVLRLERSASQPLDDSAICNRLRESMGSHHSLTLNLQSLRFSVSLRNSEESV